MPLMPLASSREASLKRAERVAAERKQQARRNSINNNKKRLWLPNTVPVIPRPSLPKTKLVVVSRYASSIDCFVQGRTKEEA